MIIIIIMRIIVIMIRIMNNNSIIRYNKKNLIIKFARGSELLIKSIIKNITLPRESADELYKHFLLSRDYRRGAAPRYSPRRSQTTVRQVKATVAFSRAPVLLFSSRFRCREVFLVGSGVGKLCSWEVSL